MTNHYIYKITLQNSNKYYIGRRSTEKDIKEDSYLGSGNWIKSIKDKSVLTKVILELCSTFEELCKAEEKWITKYFDDPNNMNFKCSSIGMPIGYKHTKETRNKMSASSSQENNPNWGRSFGVEYRNRISIATKGENNPMYGKSHTVETKQQISKAKVGSQHTLETKQKMSERTKGSGNNISKLTEAQVLEIRSLYKLNIYTNVQLSAMFNVNDRNISNIVKRKTWKHI